MVYLKRMVIIRALFLLFLFVSLSEADIYKIVGDDGVILFTDTPYGKKKERVVKEEMKVASIQKTSVILPKKKQQAENYNPIISKKAKEHDIDPSLVSAVIKAESNGNPYAVSRKGAMGLMQLMPATAGELQVRNPFNPEDNIDGGVRYLRYLIERFNGNLSLAIAAYNAGPNAVEKYGSVPPITETRQYVKKVLAYYNGKSNVSLSSNSVQKKKETIYKIALEDGTILYTNFPLYNNDIRF